MPKFVLKTKIYATPDVCFNLARSIDLHLDTMKHTGERAIAGVTTGLIGLNETVTWKAKHFGVMMKLTSKITACEIPVLFTDEMVTGPFKMMIHQHVFEQKAGYTLMTDEFTYESPLGILGKLADALFLRKYMQELIEHRNQVIKQKAEAYAK
ncbi:SRPBCC family protein [Pedobacter psychroterrae]|uniref:Cell division protein n=1 Tax=Pedobacter psychroterrae TaxID=2530453 RepID=A0A4R0NN45_9SPHI|nr:SRPBCC family protein [Pedobacter psychroterrae]TCD01659.1 cell division protein [Pedobacter psychroterrae]